MNLFIKICITYIILFFLFKLIRWLVIDIIPNVESNEGKDTVRLLVLAFVCFSLLMVILRIVFQ